MFTKIFWMSKVVVGSITYYSKLEYIFFRSYDGLQMSKTASEFICTKVLYI